VWRRARRALPGGPEQGRADTLGGSDGYGIPLGIASAGANRHDSPLLTPTLQAASRQLDGILPEDRTCHLDRGYDSTVTRQLLDELGFDGGIARKGIPAPIQADPRWVVERTHSWMNGYGKLRRCTERDARAVDFYLYLAAAFVIIRQLIQRARKRYRWDTRPTTKRLKLPRCRVLLISYRRGPRGAASRWTLPPRSPSRPANGQ
jgi:hypothetical protein